MQRYHVQVGQRKTTVSIDKIVSEYLSLRLGVAPNDPTSHSTVRKWLQDEIDGKSNPHQKHLSQWVLGQAIKIIAPEKLRFKHNRWRVAAAKAASAPARRAALIRRLASRRAKPRGRRHRADAESAIGG